MLFLEEIASGRIIQIETSKCLLKGCFIDVAAGNDGDGFLILACLWIEQCSRECSRSRSFRANAILPPEQTNSLIDLGVGNQKDLKIPGLLSDLERDSPDLPNQEPLGATHRLL